MKNLLKEPYDSETISYEELIGWQKGMDIMMRYFPTTTDDKLRNTANLEVWDVYGKVGEILKEKFEAGLDLMELYGNHGR